MREVALQSAFFALDPCADKMRGRMGMNTRIFDPSYQTIPGFDIYLVVVRLHFPPFFSCALNVVSMNFIAAKYSVS